MTINLSSEFSSSSSSSSSSSDKVRIAVYLSPFRNGNDIGGGSRLIEGNGLVPKPPSYGMGTVGYKIALIDRHDYEARRGWLRTADLNDAPKLEFEEGRYLYAGRNETTHLAAGDAIRIPYKIVLEPSDRLVDDDGVILAEISPVDIHPRAEVPVSAPVASI